MDRFFCKEGIKEEKLVDPQNSYQAKVRALARAKIKQENAFYLSLFARLTLDESFMKRKQRELQSEIDHALDRRDREAFLMLTRKYNQLLH